jgi:hypothetical protein
MIVIVLKKYVTIIYLDGMKNVIKHTQIQKQLLGNVTMTLHVGKISVKNAKSLI